MSRAKEKPGVMVYFDDIRPAMRMLDDERFGKLLRAVIDYSQMGVVPDLDDMGSRSANNAERREQKKKRQRRRRRQIFTPR